MAIDRRRFGRQIRLAEIGEAGQAKLCATSVELGSDGFARTIEESYVRASGMSVSERPRKTKAAAPSASPVLALGLRHVPAREVAEGALLALVEIRAALEGQS